MIVQFRRWIVCIALVTDDDEGAHVRVVLPVEAAGGEAGGAGGDEGGRGARQEHDQLLVHQPPVPRVQDADVLPPDTNNMIHQLKTLQILYLD